MDENHFNKSVMLPVKGYITEKAYLRNGNDANRAYEILSF